MMPHAGILTLDTEACSYNVMVFNSHNIIGVQQVQYVASYELTHDWLVAITPLYGFPESRQIFDKPSDLVFEAFGSRSYAHGLSLVFQSKVVFYLFASCYT